MFCLGIRVKTDFLLGAQFTPPVCLYECNCTPESCEKTLAYTPNFRGCALECNNVEVK